MSIHSFIVVRKIFTLPLYTVSMKTSTTFLTVLGSYEKKRQKFLTNPIVSFQSLLHGRNISFEILEFHRSKIVCKHDARKFYIANETL